MYQRSWPSQQTTKPKVLVEESSPVAQVTDFTRFRQAGFEVAVCSGPDGSDVCPLSQSGCCPLADQADVVLFGLDRDDPAAQGVLLAHRTCHPETPVVVEAPRMSVEGQIRALWAALQSV